MDIDSLKQTINQILTGTGRQPVDELRMEMRLVEDLKFDSLDLAELAVRTEAQHQVDLFQQGIPTTIEDLLARAGQQSNAQ